MKLFADSSKCVQRACATVALSAVALSSVSVAREVDNKYVMTVIADSKQGKQVVDGRYDQAIEWIESRSGRSFDANTNLCVAYTKSGALDEAQESCEAAIAEGRRPYQSGARAALHNSVNESVARTNLALALSNRGVLYAAQLKPELAKESFVEAIELGSRLAAPKQNLARLEQQHQAAEVLTRVE
jgi:tetratricopeptide (TPR) repeat protein